MSDTFWVPILGKLEEIRDWTWAVAEDGHRLTLYTRTRAFVLWDASGREHSLPQSVSKLQPAVECGVDAQGDARPVDIWWQVEQPGRITATGATLAAYGTLGYMLVRRLSRQERMRLAVPDLNTLKDLADGNIEDTMRKFMASWPDLSRDEFRAGYAHYKGVPGKVIIKKSGQSRGTVYKSIARFYKVTRLPRPDRRGFGVGKPLPLDERRDRDYPADADED